MTDDGQRDNRQAADLVFHYLGIMKRRKNMKLAVFVLDLITILPKLRASEKKFC